MKDHSTIFRTLINHENDINMLSEKEEIVTAYYLVHNDSKTDHIFIIIDNAREY
jgi:hypothetical protein